VDLSLAERTELRALLSAGKYPVRKLKRAQILLAADTGASDEAIATGEDAGGDGGIRTLDRALQPYNGLANRRLQPLGHISKP
jgi:hypothetical protein